jgi:hypothetical protein
MLRFNLIPAWMISVVLLSAFRLPQGNPPADTLMSPQVFCNRSMVWSGELITDDVMFE